MTENENRSQSLEEILETHSTFETDSLIAQLLQIDFDKEFNESVHSEEKLLNGSSKVSISLSNFKIRSRTDIDSEENQESEEIDMNERDWDLYESFDKESLSLPKVGYRKIGNQIVTKHDSERCHRNNGKKIMDLMDLETGDGAGFDMQIPNHVFNAVRNFSVKDGKRQNRIVDKVDKSTSNGALDPKTRLLIYKLINNEILESVGGVISTGKEAVIMFGEGGRGPADLESPMQIPSLVAIKIYKTSCNEFKTREKYISNDYRFRNRFSKQNPQKVIHMWAEKEMRNLTKIARCSSLIRVPKVVILKKHVLVMSFIGTRGQPASKLKDADLSEEKIREVYEEILQVMISLYNDVDLIHADLSEYNILIFENQVYIIDVSQSVERNHAYALEFLYRDCSNISNFFSSKLNGIQGPEDIFNRITGYTLNKDHGSIMSQIHKIQESAYSKFGDGGSQRRDLPKDLNQFSGQDDETSENE